MAYPAATTCKTRWRLSPSHPSSACRSNERPQLSASFGEPNGVLVVDDYGHHPTEIKAVLDAARSLGRRIIVAFQPHRYTRTASLMDAFGPALSNADYLVLTDIYPAGEDPLPGITVEALAAAIRRAVKMPVEVVPRLEHVVPAIARVAGPGDVVITLGAGSIGTLADQVVAALESRS